MKKITFMEKLHVEDNGEEKKQIYRSATDRAKKKFWAYRRKVETGGTCCFFLGTGLEDQSDR